MRGEWWDDRDAGAEIGQGPADADGLAPVWWRRPFQAGAVGAAQGLVRAVDLQARQGHRRPFPDGGVVAVQEGDQSGAATWVRHRFEDLDGGQLTEAAEGGQSVDEGGD